MPTQKDLVAAARQVRLRAHAPYSNFKVGAALLCDDDVIITGCNVENATYGLTICAERVAIVKAISEGYAPDRFKAVAIVGDTNEPTPPCGACRQILWEFCGNVDVILANLNAIKGRHKMADLLPLPFDGRLLKG